jgi:hypothetical protein
MLGMPSRCSRSRIEVGCSAAIGIGVLAFGLRRRPSVWLIWASAAVLILALVPWLWHLYGRSVDPIAFAEGRWPRWPLLAYVMLTEAGLAILGYALLRSDLPAWISSMLIGSMVLLFVLTLIFRDMVPFDVLPGDPDIRNSARHVNRFCGPSIVSA